MATIEPIPQERSVGALFGELATETSTLVRQEVHLAAREMSQNVGYLGRQSVPVLVGGALGLASLMALVGGIVVLLARWIPLWASALIVAAVVGAVAYGLANAGIRAIKRVDLKPTQTIGSLKDDKTWTANLFH